MALPEVVTDPSLSLWNSTMNLVFPWSARRCAKAGHLVRLIAGVVALAPAASHAQSTKDLMGRSQSQSQQKAVEDLIRKLQGSGPATPAAMPAAAMPAAASPAPQPPGQPSFPAEPPQVAVKPVPLPAMPPAAARPAAEAVTIEPPAAPGTVVPAAPAAPARIDAARIDAMPSVDIEIYFDSNSESITRQAAETLATLARALADPRLAGARFLIGGHSDARGAPEANLRLSERRAAAVRRHLIEQHGLDAARLVSRGFGQQRLKLPDRPQAVENRRVQIVNLTGPAER